jgi:formylglycine-generating enzyme required for sulfatase activity
VSASVRDGVTDAQDRPTVAGTWTGAHERPCGAPATEGRVCIPGGFSVLGDPVLSGFATDVSLDAVPQKPVLVSPFFMDKTELTVGRFRELVVEGNIHGTLPAVRSTSEPNATWLGPYDSSNDDLPVNYIQWPTAKEACEALGGRLPTEAEYEHAARGRGQERRFPWGDQAPTCCAAAILRVTAFCDGTVDAVGSHADPASCDGIADVSRDGVLDLAGNVSEMTSDAFVSYDAPCWSRPGILVDPSCEAGADSQHVARGGSWGSGTIVGLGAWRGSSLISSDVGVRCVYPDGAK